MMYAYQGRFLKRFIQGTLGEIGELESEEQEDSQNSIENDGSILQEAYHDVMAAHKDLTELSDEIECTNPRFHGDGHLL